MSIQEYFLVVERGKTLRFPGFLRFWIGFIIIWLTIIPVVLSDLSIRFYHWAYFSLYRIPKVPRKEHIVIDRGRLNGLTFMQKLACMYCGYANGFASWSKAVANRTEIYSCAVKHKTKSEGQEHQKDFYAYEEFLKKR